MGKGKSRKGGMKKHKNPNSRDRLQVARHLYEEVQRQFRIHDDANINLEKKAQNLMIASALVATLFASVTVTHDSVLQLWGLLGWYIAIVPVSGMVVTILLCMLVNKPSDHRAPIKSEGLLCHDELDEKTYEYLVSDEERYYRLRIKEFALALNKMEVTNKTKASRLVNAYVTFATSVAVYVPVLGATIVL